MNERKFKIGDRVVIKHSKTIFHNMTGTVKECYNDSVLISLDQTINIHRKDGCFYFSENKLELYVSSKANNLDSNDLFDNWLDEIDNQINNNNSQEREDNNMAIRNEKVVELYFKREHEKLIKTFEENKEKAIKKDENQKFVETLKCQFDQYVKAEEELGHQMVSALCNIQLPYTEETHKKIRELEEEYNVKRLKDLKKKEEEIRALLSGCENYEQEMRILNTYKIVEYTNNILALNNHGSETD